MLNTLFLAAMLQTGIPQLAAQTDTNSSSGSEIASNPTGSPIPVIEVISRRQDVGYSTDSSLSALMAADIQAVSPHHPNELFSRVPGVWVSEGSGQEHLTAIRSPVITGAGACGAYMVLEDSVPIRPAGFCNVNQLFEVNLLQAQRVDVLRGPGTVTYGSNALHGSISIFTPGPGRPSQDVAVEYGSFDYLRAQTALSGEQVALQANYTDSGSFRDYEHYSQALINFQMNHEIGQLSGRTSVAYAMLDQDTAGYIQGKKSYKNEALRTENLNPEAFRKAWALRLSSRWKFRADNGTQFELIPYVRSSSMDFLQHFLPGKPLEENAQDSAGVLFTWQVSEDLTAGFDLEWANGSLVEFQQDPLEEGSDFLKATRPQGYHYDYSVRALNAAGWVQWQHQLNQSWQLTAGLRAEYLRYNYSNHMLDGNTRDDGTACGYGGCLYTRPSDRSDGFTNLAPELGLSYEFDQQNRLYLRAARGFRAPQATELYRLQKGQIVADLEPETLDSLEVGWKHSSGALRWQLALYAMRKHHYIFRDADGYNISDGKTRDMGIEAELGWQLSDKLLVTGNVSWARHEYDFNRDLGGSEIISKGNEIDTAPAWLGALQLNWKPAEPLGLEAEWLYQGGYFIDAANAHRYPGHDLVNLRARMVIAKSKHSLVLRLNNLFDVRYAERADYAFGNYRYFPGAGRRISLEWQYSH